MRKASPRGRRQSLLTSYRCRMSRPLSHWSQLSGSSQSPMCPRTGASLRFTPAPDWLVWRLCRFDRPRCVPLLRISLREACVTFLCACCSLRVVVEDGRMKGVEWTGNSRWMPVTIGLVGAAMDMRAIGPTLRLTSPFLVCIDASITVPDLSLCISSCCTALGAALGFCLPAYSYY